MVQIGSIALANSRTCPTATQPCNSHPHIDRSTCCVNQPSTVVVAIRTSTGSAQQELGQQFRCSPPKFGTDKVGSVSASAISHTK